MAYSLRDNGKKQKGYKLMTRGQSENGSNPIFKYGSFSLTK